MITKPLKIYKCDVLYITKPIFINFSQKQTTNKSLQDVVTDRKITTRTGISLSKSWTSTSPVLSDHCPIPPQQRSKGKALRLTSSFNLLILYPKQWNTNRSFLKTSSRTRDWDSWRREKVNQYSSKETGEKKERKLSPLSKRHFIDLGGRINQIVNEVYQPSQINTSDKTGTLVCCLMVKKTSYFKDVLFKSAFYID